MKGQTALTLVFLVGSIAILVGATLAFIATNLTNSSLGFKISEQVIAAAASGIYDALLQLVRNYNFSSNGYTIVIGGANVDVSVSQGGGTATIISTATFKGYQRKIEAIVKIDSLTKAINLVSWRELTI